MDRAWAQPSAGGRARPAAESAGRGPERGDGTRAAAAERGPSVPRFRATAAARVPEQIGRAAGGGARDGVDAPGKGAVVRRHLVREQILQALRAALAGGELVPGEVYSAPALAGRFGVSATPVREAMQQLAADGAVDVVPNRGFRVAVRSPRELAQLAEVRALIEVPVVLELARSVPRERWAALRPLADAAASAAATGDRARYGEADRAFHRVVLALSGNDQLVTVADDLHRRSQWPLRAAGVDGAASAPGRAALIADAAEHGALLDALTAGDLAAVEALLRGHLRPA
ncbi:GntR family transcriptional regulator [Streptomyces sp. NPDC020412]|uniref:GntR family transcriptional regulator n=1 Tax=Streptomyces sp. NPDC020412 TaxID=3365073 RepID=UPI003795BFF9